MKQVASEVKDVSEEEIPGTGQWHQKFALFMSGDPVTEQPFDRIGTKPDLSDSKLTDGCTDGASLNIVENILEATKGWVMNLLTPV
jgi:hypothetical protein